MNKYTLDKTDSITHNDITLYRIKALKPFGNVKMGDKGGYMENYGNLSHDGNCWVTEDAIVSENATVYGNALIGGSSEITGNSKVFGNAKVYGNSQISGYAQVAENAEVFGNTTVSGHSEVFGNASSVLEKGINEIVEIVEIVEIHTVTGDNIITVTGYKIIIDEKVFKYTVKEYNIMRELFDKS